jgi:hypothetical protein
LRRDECGDYTIIGKLGHIYTDDQGFLLYVTAPGSPRRWSLVKRRLAFCSLKQDGDDEGCLYLDRLPEPAEAELIREALGIRNRRHLSPEQLVARMPLGSIQNRDKRAPGGPAFAQNVEEHLRAQYVEGLVLGNNKPFFRNAAVR